MLIQFFKKNGWRYIPGGVLLVVCAWIQTRSPLALGGAIAAANAGVWDDFSRLTVQLLVIALGVFITRFGWRWFIIRTSRELEVYLRDKLYAHMTRLPVSFYGHSRSGDLMSYAINDVNAVRMMFGMIVAQVLNSLSSLMFSVGEMATGINASLTLYALLPAPVAIITVLILGRKIQARAKRAQELFTTLSGHVQENISGMRVLKAFAQENPQYAEYERESAQKREANMRLYFTGAMIDPVIKVLFGISYAVGLVYGGQLVLNNTISLADYVAFNTYLPMIVWPVVAVGRISNNLQRGMASYKRLRALLDAKEIDAFERKPDGKSVGNGIVASHLSWRYDDANKDALTDISFSLAPGGMLGVVGPTGGGKSSLVTLITKLNAPARGQLRIGGRDILDIPACSLRAHIGYVPQDGFLFDASIRENVDFFSGASEDEIWRALDDAGMAEDIAQLSDGLDTMCGERGNHLSGGQRQRVSLARALVRNPGILLLDDTLSAVDAETEREILARMKSRLEGRTAVVVSHRLSAVRDADEILYIDEGRVIERGTHAELCALGGEYARMLERQSAPEKHNGAETGAGA